MSFTTILPSTEIRGWSIYRFISPSQRAYIGLTSDVNKRLSVYRSNATSRQTLIFNSIKKYGYDSHRFDIIESFMGDFNYAADKEMFWIRSCMSNKNKFPEQNGLNLTNGGDGTAGYKHTPEQVERNRQSKIGKKQDPDVVKRRAEKQRGKKMNFTHMTDEFKKMLSDRNRKYRHTEEAKKKIGQASKGNKHRLGHKMTQEQIEHRSSKIRGRKITGDELQRHIERIQKACGKPILQYDLNGNFIKEYPMLITASKELGIPGLGIYRNLVGKYKQSRGFIFKYKKDAANT